MTLDITQATLQLDRLFRARLYLGYSCFFFLSSILRNVGQSVWNPLRSGASAEARSLAVLLLIPLFVGLMHAYRGFGMVMPRRRWPSVLIYLCLLIIAAFLLCIRLFWYASIPKWTWFLLSDLMMDFVALLGLLVGSILGITALRQFNHPKVVTFSLVDLMYRLNTHDKLRPVAFSMSRILRGFVALIFVMMALLMLPLYAITSASLLGQPLMLMLVSFLFIMAKRLLQPRALDVMTNDSRPVYLFLRPFKSEEELNTTDYGWRKLLDFSLEARLAKHFFSYGPLLAISQPKQPRIMPPLGAARLQLADTEWQSQVLQWLEGAKAIITYAGSSPGVIWELEQIVQRDYVEKLILLCPIEESGGLEQHWAMIRAVFSESRWTKDLPKESELPHIDALAFEEDGRVTLITSGIRSRTSAQLAALICHDRILSRA